MKILVTGAGGYLAEQLILRLATQGHRVIAMYRYNYRDILKDADNVTLMRADLLDKDSLYEVVDGCEEIYHVAAYAKSWSKDSTVFYETNVGGTLNILDVAKELGVKRIVVTSTAGAIGPASVGSLVVEGQYRKTGFFGDYESSKFIMNEKIQDYVRNGMDIRIVCPTRIFGPGNLNSMGSKITQIFDSYLSGKWRIQPGDGSARANYAYIDDVVNGHILAMQNGVSGEKYLIGSFNESLKGIMETLGIVSGKKHRLFNIPFSVLRGYAFVVGVIARIFPFDPVITKEWIDKLGKNWETDISKAINELGFTPTSKEESIRLTVDWLKKSRK